MTFQHVRFYQNIDYNEQIIEFVDQFFNDKSKIEIVDYFFNDKSKIEIKLSMNFHDKHDKSQTQLDYYQLKRHFKRNSIIINSSVILNVLI